MITFKKLSGNDDLTDSLNIRRQVFIKEQKVPENLEVDGQDQIASHYIGYSDGQPVAAARVRFLDATTAKIERVSVKKIARGTGLGGLLMQYIEADLKKSGAIKAILESQMHASKFYEKLGYQAIGERFEDAGILHIKMQKNLS